MSWSIPIKTDHMLKQSGHEPSMQYAKDIYKVACDKTITGFAALEIGGAWGFSTLAILEAGAGHLITVDSNVLAEAHNEAEANNYQNHQWLNERSDTFWSHNRQTFDLIYVDGSHLYVDVVNDLQRAWASLNPEGLLMIDDWDHKKNIQPEDDTTEYGVSLACFEFWRDHVNSIVSVGIKGRVLWFKK